MKKIRLTESQFNRLVSKCVKKALRESMMDEYEGDNGNYEGYSPMPHYSDAEIKKMQMDDDWNEFEQNPPYKPFETQYQKDFDYSENGNRNLNNTNGKYAMDALKYPNGYQGKGFGGLFYGNGIYKRSSLADERNAKRR